MSDQPTSRAPQVRADTDAARVFGTLLETRRTAQGLSRAELARRLEIDVSTVYRLETGGQLPSVSMLVGLAHELGLNLGDLECLADAELPEEP